MDGDNFTHTVIDKDKKVVFTGIPNTCTNRHTYQLTLTGDGVEVLNDFDDPQNIAVDLNNLFIGRTYFVRIIIPHEDGKICDEIEKKFTLGGVRVARDVKLKLGKTPNRWIDVSFDQPLSTTGLLYYRVRAICNGGPNREQKAEKLSTTMKFLKSETKYQITVTAVYDDYEQCLASTSNSIHTGGRAPGYGQVPPVFNIRGLEGTLDLSQSTIQQTVIDALSDRSSDFGTVENLQERFENDKINFVKLFLRWNQPSFSDHGEDYFITTFQVEVFEEGGGKHGGTENVDFVPENHLHEYICGPLKIIENKPYVIRVKTFYENVDTTKKYASREVTKTVKSGLETNKQIKKPTGDTLNLTTSASMNLGSQLLSPNESLSNVQDREVGRGNVRSKWTQEKKIERGRFADLYIVSSHQNPVALEMEMTFEDADPSVIEEVANRMQIVVSLDHERLLKYIEYIPDPPNYSIYMEHLNWQSLESHTKEKNPNQGIEENEAATYTRQILEGITFLHSKGLIHGDLQCSNIFWNELHGIKIGEFAVGRSIEEKLTTYSRSSYGKFTNWSPEEIGDDGNYVIDESDDVWGVGCTVYEMLTGKPPLYDKGWTQRRLFTATTQIPLIPDTSEQLKEFLSKSMNRREQRISISELKSLQWIPKPNENPVEIDSRSEHNEYLHNITYIEKIARGTFGDVYKASTKNGKLFAMKEIEVNQEKCEKPEREYDFAHEKACHEHLIKFYGRKMENDGEKDKYFLAMELMEKSLRQEIKADEGFTEAKTRKYARQIMEGLSYLHRIGYIHRDIRGDNILISFDGVIKIADFGFIKKLHRKKEQNVTRDGIGTVRWMSPEAVKGIQPVTEKTDVWSLGCTIIEMLKVKPPFENNFGEMKVKEMILENKIVLYIPTGISESLKKLLKDVFKQEERDRPAVYKLLTEYEWMGESLTTQ
ncbi:uncharacterized protein LOC144422878 isoform X2 [Styela clava]